MLGDVDGDADDDDEGITKGQPGQSIEAGRVALVARMHEVGSIAGHRSAIFGPQCRVLSPVGRLLLCLCSVRCPTAATAHDSSDAFQSVAKVVGHDLWEHALVAKVDTWT